MYLTHFGFHTTPFSQTPNTELFLALPPHYEAIQTVMSALSMGEGMVKLTGEVGTGKTMVCRMLIEQLDQSSQLIYLPNPVLNQHELQLAVASELGLTIGENVSVVAAIQQALIQLRQQDQRAVLLVDEAQALPDESLEALRLLGNLETEQDKLLQIVLIGQPELDERLQSHQFRQLRQRIAFHATLRPLTVEETLVYVPKRLQQSGCQAALLSKAQIRAIWQSTQGVPRLINQLCHKALLMAFHQGDKRLNNKHLFSAMNDTYDAKKPRFHQPYLWGWSRS